MNSCDNNSSDNNAWPALAYADWERCAKFGPEDHWPRQWAKLYCDRSKDLIFDFLEAKFRDRTHGGYFAKVADDGKPTDRRKHVYLNAFALYGLAAYHRASGDATALVAATPGTPSCLHPFELR